MKSKDNYTPISYPLIGALVALIISIFLSQQLEIQRLREYVDRQESISDHNSSAFRLYKQELLTDSLGEEFQRYKVQQEELHDRLWRLQIKVKELEWQRLKESWK